MVICCQLKVRALPLASSLTPVRNTTSSTPVPDLYLLLFWPIVLLHSRPIIVPLCLSICNAAGTMYKVKSCTSVYLADSSFVPSDTFAALSIVYPIKRTEKSNRRKRKREFFETNNQA